MDANSSNNNNNISNNNTNSNSNANGPNEAFNFDYTLPTNNDVYQNLMMTDGALFGTTAAIPDNLFEFITNDNPTCPLDPAVQIDSAATDNVVNNDFQPAALSGQQQTTVQGPPAAVAAVAGQKRTRQDDDDARPQPQQTGNSVCTTPSSNNTKSVDDSQYEPPKQAMFAIVVGGRPFRLSWESIKSDGPQNFFTEYFRRSKNTRIMHVDREPDVFNLVVQHLRGYYVQPRDQLQNQALLSDANYYGLKRLRAFLLQYLFVNVGGRVFRLPWSLFQKGNFKPSIFFSHCCFI
ncbi:hypothetical protein BDB00DRAFT_850875 [Zychaea mexicana]|uniref:uncharacterized protein n=1 Tax=Zychaea mexicana TaxID=64656 RepID=UPI0022FDE0CC|nr:uncharacterized protein BDB00DRAFT_850875 [Zychaea mexicana]KAI9487967.1 hypothetical protein BDB00DRAFT_850875 [Zychaea mexicana]